MRRRRIEQPPKSNATTVLVLMGVLAVGGLGFVYFNVGDSKPQALMTDEELADEVLRARNEDFYTRCRASGLDVDVENLKRNAERARPEIIRQVKAERARGKRDEDLRREFRDEWKK